MSGLLKILFLAAEAAPFVKVGGLGDVAGTLPLALRRQGLDIRLALPLHHQIDRAKFELQEFADVEVPSINGPVPARVYETVLGDDLPVYLIDSSLMPAEGPVYAADSAIDGPKFVHFSLAALAFCRRMGWAPDVLHAQDWHTAPAVYAISLQRGADSFFKHTASLLTVHNLPYHGEGAADAMLEFGLPPADDSHLPWWAKGRPLALGLMAADHINTVSPGYAAEMLTEEFGAGLDAYLRTYKAGALSGILNGLDLEAWNPEKDPAIPARYSRRTLKDKLQNKAALLAAASLPARPRTPVFGIVSRMDAQKGIDIALDALRETAALGWQAVILGTGNPAIETSALRLAEELPARVHTRIDFDAPFGRLIYAGADAFLIPSRYEPCGLTQMISMRYGTLPLARAVGGLKDTILDYDLDRAGSTGFLFKSAVPGAMAAAIRRLIEVYGDQRRWRGLQRRAMKQDFSWEISAGKYASLYRRLAGLRA